MKQHPQSIDHQFEVIKLLGEGMSAQVFKVKRGEEIWALKLMKSRPMGLQREEWIDAFKFEFSLLKDIVHPYVVRIGDFGWDKSLNQLYFTQEFVDGTPLNSFLKNKPVETTIDLFVGCLEGLSAIHQAGALHGDIKPSNIYVVETERGPVPKILDLGLAHPKFKLSGGTPAYFAPEKILQDEVDCRADLYSLGVTFTASLTGANPFVRPTVPATLKAHTSVTPAAPGSLNPKIPPYLNRILVTLLEKNPRDRYRNAQEILREIDFARGESAIAPKLPVVTEKWIDRNGELKKIDERIGQRKGFEVIALVGVAGMGKSLLLQEAKYLLELKGHSVRTVEGEGGVTSPEEVFTLWDASHLKPGALETPIKKLVPGTMGLILTVEMDDEKGLRTFVEKLKIPFYPLILSPFSKENLRQLLSLSTGDPNPPDDFIDHLFAETKGHPAHTIHLLAAICEGHKLLGPHGEWNVALFREGLAEQKTKPQSIEILERLLAETPPERPLERSRLLLELVEQKMRRGEAHDVSRLLTEIASATDRMPPGEERIHLRIEELEKEIWLAIHEGNSAKAKNKIEASRALLPEAKGLRPEVVLRIENFEAFLLDSEGQHEKAVEIFSRTHRQWKERLDETQKKAVVNNDLGIALMHQGNDRAAVDAFLEFLDFYKTLPDSFFKNRCHYNLGECFSRLNDFATATGHYQEAVSGARNDKQWNLLLRAYNGLGNATLKQKKREEALTYYERAFDLARYLKDTLSASAIAQNVAGIRRQGGDLKGGLESLNHSLKLLDLVTDSSPLLSYLKTRSLLTTGEIERELKNFSRARELLQEASTIAFKTKGQEDLRFWILIEQGALSLDENRMEEFLRIFPNLLYHAKSDEQKRLVEELRTRSPIDPTKPRERRSIPPSLGDLHPHPAPSHQGRGDETIVAGASSAEEQTIQTRSKALSFILETNRLLNSERNLTTLLSLIIKYALSLSEAESGLILLAAEDGVLRIAASQNITIDDDLSQISQKIAQRVLAEGRPVKSDNALEDKSFKNYRSVVALGLKSVFCLPVRSQGKIVGVLYLLHRFQKSLFSDPQEKILQTFADQAGVAIENARLIALLEEKKKLLEERLESAEEKITSYESVIREGSLERSGPFGEMVTASSKMREIFSLIHRIGPTNVSVLVRGESGTGKELIARAIHASSDRKEGRFVAVNCAALPPTLVESELFGYRAGAFTGAARDKKGLFQEAEGGSLFLDEIGDFDLPLQAKLLRVLQEREVMRIGDTKPIPINIRILCATLKDLKTLTSTGNFREDLLYRIAEIELSLPPLRDRREDIPLLVEHFAQKFFTEHGIRRKPTIDPKLMRLFLGYGWPGNVRELSNRVRVACALSDKKRLQLSDLPPADRATLEVGHPRHEQRVGAGIHNLSPRTGSRLSESSAGAGMTTIPSEFLIRELKTWRQIETALMAKALIKTDFDIASASRSLGVGPATLYNKIRTEKIRERIAGLTALPFDLPTGVSLDEMKKKIFETSLRITKNKIYRAADLLGVSPTMMYVWTRKQK